VKTLIGKSFFSILALIGVVLVPAGSHRLLYRRDKRKSRAISPVSHSLQIVGGSTHMEDTILQLYGLLSLE